MDSRIEELALIIRERAKDAADNVRKAAGGIQGDRYHSWQRLHTLAGSILDVLEDYRKAHPEEYIEESRDAEAERLRGMVSFYVSELVDTRQQLARYKEREAVQGWAPL